MHLRSALLLFAAATAVQAGIPEPGLTLYGVVRQNIGGAHARLTTGTLEVTITPSVGAPLVLNTTLTNLNSQFSYVLQVPFESSVAGFPASASALELTVAPSSFTRNPVKINNVNGTILAPATTAMSFGQANRGTIDRMDVAVTLPLTDTDGDGLPNDWETLHFGNATIANPNLDSDGDGFTNRQEYLAGTNPNDIDSVLFMEIESLTGGGIQVRWQGAPNRIYTLLRSTQISTGYAPIATGISSAHPALNVFNDLTANSNLRYFYRAQVE
jgi:hypothetical protein